MTQWLPALTLIRDLLGIILRAISGAVEVDAAVLQAKELSARLVAQLDGLAGREADEQAKVDAG